MKILTLTKKQRFKIFNYLLGICLITCLCFQPVFSQTTENARRHITNLAGENMFGRGYVFDGLSRAESYIDSCFSAYNLAQFSSLKGYKQKVSYSANTFPGEMQVICNDSILTPGIDFMIEPHSPELSGSFECVVITKADIFLGKKIPNLDNKVLVIDDRNPMEIEKKELDKINQSLLYTSVTKTKIAAIVELTDKKLSWNCADFTGNCPYIKINSVRLPETIETIEFNIEQKFVKKYKSNNLCGYIEGTEKPDSLLVFTAHYDHLGMMGMATAFPGANDNASGVAMLLELIDYYTQNPPPYTLVFIAFTGEEMGLLGSQHFVDKPPFELSAIRFLINFDLAGTGGEGIQIVNSTVFTQEVQLLDSLNTAHSLLPQIKKRGESCNSDHCPFYQKNVPSYFIYTLGGIDAYHDVYDRPETLPLTAFGEYAQLIQLFVSHL
ncbi:MAG: M28 family peptidase [Bacteroidales bacterium]|jgi:aminopeptidase YwaD|nr:M28 family peptidase [Bacteroidales bacterium]